jgi:hypothetical protein
MNGKNGVLAITLWCCALTSFGRSFYVAPTGSDSNAGTENKPFKTVAKGVAAANPGDIVILKDGIYRSEGYVSDGTGGWHGYASPVMITKAGKPDAWITIRAEHKGSATLDCETTSARRGCDVYIYLKKTAAYWAFENLVLTGGAYAGINTNEGAHHVRITGCEFTHIGNHPYSGEIGIVGVGFAPSSATDWWIEDNEFHDIGRTGGRYPNLDHGLYAGGEDATIIRNRFYRNTAGWHIQTTKGARHWLIANNTFAFPHPKLDGAIMLWDGDQAGSISDIDIRNNIFYNVRGPAVVSLAKSISGCLIESNLTTASRIFDEKTACTLRGNATGSDPKFVNSAREPYDFHLAAASPALTQGAYGKP